jgi:hypothetical protein
MIIEHLYYEALRQARKLELQTLEEIDRETMTQSGHIETDESVASPRFHSGYCGAMRRIEQDICMSGEPMGTRSIVGQPLVRGGAVRRFRASVRYGSPSDGQESQLRAKSERTQCAADVSMGCVGGESTSPLPLSHAAMICYGRILEIPYKPWVLPVPLIIRGVL